MWHARNSPLDKVHPAPRLRVHSSSLWAPSSRNAALCAPPSLGRVGETETLPVSEVDGAWRITST